MKRLNIKFVAGLLIAFGLVTSGVFGLHHVQVKRHSEGAFETAKEAYERAKAHFLEAETVLKEANATDGEDNDHRKKLEETYKQELEDGRREMQNAVRSLRRFVAYHPDHAESLVMFAECLRDSVGTNQDPGVRNRAWKATLAAIRVDTDNADLRRDAALFASRFIGLTDALLQQEYLVTKLNEEATIDDELFLAQLYLAGQQTGKSIATLRSIIGFNERERRFDDDAARATDNHTIYVLLATIYRNNREEDLGDLIIDKMVESNPNSFEAHRDRATYLLGSTENRFEDAAVEAERALDLEPNDVNTILVAVHVYMRQQKYEKARDLLEKGREVHETEVRMYLTGADVASRLRDPNDAIRIVKQGLERVAPQYHRPLLWQQVNLELQSGEILFAEATLLRLREALGQQGGDSWPEREDYIEGRILLTKGKWVKAARTMERVRPALEALGSGAELNQFLINCYAKLGQTDLQLEAVRRMIELLPSNLRVRLIEAEVLLGLGKTSEAAEALERMLIIASIEENDQLDLLPQIVNSLLSIRINEQARKPAELQDWSEVEELLRQLLAFEGVDEIQTELLLISLQETRGYVDKARERLAQAREDHPEHLGLWLREIQAIYQDEDASAALAALDQLEDELGESTTTRVTRAGYLVVRGGENVRQELALLEQDIVGEDDKKGLWRGLASVYRRRLSDVPNAVRLLLLVAENDPEDLPVRMEIFQLAIQAGDEAESNRSLDRIETLCGEDDASWQFARALQLIWQHQEESAGEEALDEALSNLQLARRSRPKWHVLSRLEAEIAMAQGRTDAAVDAYQAALDEGPDDPAVQQRLVTLLYDVGRTAEADRLLRSIPPEALTGNLEFRKIAGEVSAGGDPEMLRQHIERSLPADSDDLAILLRRYYALQSIGDPDEAEGALRRAVEVAPTSSDAWLTLVRHLTSAGKQEEAEVALRTAQMRMPESEVPLLLGQGYEELRLFPLAKQAYQMALSSAPENTTVLRRVARFYLVVNNREQARVHLNKILSLSSGENFYSDEAKWARRTLAQLLAQSGSFSDFGEALKFIERNVEKGQEMDSTDFLLWATLSANRQDPTSRQVAIQRLEEERKRLDDNLSDDLLFVLARLYYRTNRWEDCEVIMRDLATRNSNSPVIIGAWCGWLLEQERYRDVAVQVQKLDKNSASYIRIEAHRMAREGDTEEAILLIRGLLAESLDDVPPDQNDSLMRVAGLFNELASYDTAYRDQAETLYRYYVQREPRRVLILAAFLGSQIEPEKLEEAFNLLEEARLELGLTSVVQVAVGSLRFHRDTLPADSPYYTLVENWFDLWEIRFPDAKALQTQRAEFEDMRGNYDEVERRYRLFLARDDIEDNEKAVIQNNLAFIMALRGKGDAALSLVDKAINQLGPLSDLLDTRAMVYLAIGDFENAAHELNRALADGDEPVKLFHLAQAYEPSNHTASIDKLEKAFELGFDPSTLAPLERQMFRELLRQLDMEEADFVTSLR